MQKFFKNELPSYHGQHNAVRPQPQPHHHHHHHHHHRPQPETPTPSLPVLPNLPTDFGGKPFVVDIAKATLHNDNFRTALWSGTHLQLTLMCIPPGESIGLEAHPHVDQFLRLEQGSGLVQMGDSSGNLSFAKPVFDDSAVFVPAGTWHNITNTGNTDMKLYSIYAPPNHPFGTIHRTKEIAEASEH
ncbi:MAG: cupin domain-containing protein [Defluviitaleaceae bacterium]|nr:cupin domain-containing protein [Defluviitaleaceae bacterium]